MRGFLFLTAASADFRVKVLVVPAAGDPGVDEAGCRTGPAQVSVLPMPDSAEIAAAAPRLLASPLWRRRISRAYPLPPLATMAPPTLAAAAEHAIRPRPGTPVHVARSYLAPLGMALAERIGAGWATLDLDDDDEQLARSAGDEAAAAGYSRLVATFGPLFQGVALAAAQEAAAIAQRHDLATTVLPNAIGPAVRPPVPRRPGGDISLLFVGNLTYWPNADAASRIVREVAPLLRRLTARPVRVTLVGRTGQDARLARLATVPGVRMTGFVADLAPVYRDADVVVAPLAHAAGTRIKLLEAFSYGVPVVTTTPGAAGLSIVAGQHALIADSAAAMAAVVAMLVEDGGLRDRLAANGRALVRESYSHAAVIPRIREFFATARHGQRVRVSPG